ncbi:MAG: hypothetical protein C4547_13695 [Phycisphaerales bacterium]|nr:MAG: hypothetical protein C4547_13695 [Phycisphaerales bacterium]
MSPPIVLSGHDETIELLESVSDAVSVTLPSGKRLWVCPDEHLEDLCDVLTDAEFREAIKRGIDEAKRGEFVEIEASQLK